LNIYLIMADEIIDKLSQSNLVASPQLDRIDQLLESQAANSLSAEEMEQEMDEILADELATDDEKSQAAMLKKMYRAMAAMLIRERSIAKAAAEDDESAEEAEVSTATTVKVEVTIS